ncbi:MAG TPA: DUF2007 domain-containing protein [Verrucomicrobiae bacterium]|nr:DUF2007 domain-containing protein [Verrucomicrobiae bacterium]
MDSEADDPKSHDDAKMVTVHTFNSHQIAELAAANLEAHGIACWIHSDDASGMLPNLTIPGGVRLQVHESDAEAAIALLNAQITSTGFLASNQIQTGGTSVFNAIPATNWATGHTLAGFIVGSLVASMCFFLFFPSRIFSKNKTHYHYTVDGKRDEVWIYQNGNLVEHDTDRNLDGAWDHWAYYEHGAVARIELDNNFDGKRDETWTYSNGMAAKMEKDTDFNGVSDEFCTYKYGVLQQVDLKPNGSKFAIEREIFQNGVLTERWLGGDSTGNFREIVYYDPFWNPISTNLFPSQIFILSK